MSELQGGLVFIAIVGYGPFSWLCVRRFRRYMLGRTWTPTHGILYASLLAFFYTPGCLALDLVHGNAFPLPMPAWVALANGSIFGGLAPLVIGWCYAYGRVQPRVIPKWLEDEKERTGVEDPPE